MINRSALFVPISVSKSVYEQCALRLERVAQRSVKDSNLRSLLADLHPALWSGLGWQKVGMHKIVTPELWFMKAIGKLPPVKVRLTFPGCWHCHIRI